MPGKYGTSQQKPVISASSGCAALIASGWSVGYGSWLFREPVHTSGAIFLIPIGSQFFGFVLSTSRTSFAMSGFITESDFTHWQMIALIMTF